MAISTGRPVGGSNCSRQHNSGVGWEEGVGPSQMEMYVLETAVTAGLGGRAHSWMTLVWGFLSPYLAERTVGWPASWAFGLTSCL